MSVERRVSVVPTKTQFTRLMRQYARHAEVDPETAHHDADRLMASVLSEIGYEVGIKAFLDMERWYA